MLYTAPEFRPPGMRSSRTAEKMKGGNLINGRLLSKAFHLLLRLTGKNHALLQTFLETAKLTSVTLSFVNLTIAVRNATVNPLVLNSTFEESFASAIEKGTYD